MRSANLYSMQEHEDTVEIREEYKPEKKEGVGMSSACLYKLNLSNTYNGAVTRAYSLVPKLSPEEQKEDLVI